MGVNFSILSVIFGKLKVPIWLFCFPFLSLSSQLSKKQPWRSRSCGGLKRKAARTIPAPGEAEDARQIPHHRTYWWPHVTVIDEWPVWAWRRAIEAEWAVRWSMKGVFFVLTDSGMTGSSILPTPGWCWDSASAQLWTRPWRRPVLEFFGCDMRLVGAVALSVRCGHISEQ